MNKNIYNKNLQNANKTTDESKERENEGGASANTPIDGIAEKINLIQ